MGNAWNALTTDTSSYGQVQMFYAIAKSTNSNTISANQTSGTAIFGLFCSKWTGNESGHRTPAMRNTWRTPASAILSIAGRGSSAESLRGASLGFCRFFLAISWRRGSCERTEKASRDAGYLIHRGEE
jgi:hypothetical protein